MVKYKTLIKVIEKEIAKCHVTLKSVREQIRPLLESITDTEEEYDLLMEKIPRFYRDYRTSNKEYEYMIDSIGNEYNTIGDGNSVRLSDKDQDKLFANRNKGVTITLGIHNHPSGINFPSIGDLNSQEISRKKYSVIVSKNGIAINKQNLEGWNEPNYLKRHGKINESYWGMERGLRKEIETTPEYKDLVRKYHNDVRPIKEKLKTPNLDIDTIIELEDKQTELLGKFHKDVRKMTINKLGESIPQSQEALNKGYNDNEVPMEVYAISIKNN